MSGKHARKAKAWPSMTDGFKDIYFEASRTKYHAFGLFLALRTGL